jgi:hypothetical protein
MGVVYGLTRNRRRVTYSRITTPTKRVQGLMYGRPERSPASSTSCGNDVGWQPLILVMLGSFKKRRRFLFLFGRVHPVRRATALPPLAL